MSARRNGTGGTARCLEFTILTVAGTGEAIMVSPEEFDLDRATWTISAVRMGVDVTVHGFRSQNGHAAYALVHRVEIVSALLEIGFRELRE